MVQYIEAKSILSKLNTSDSLFGMTYSMNLYRGCQHGCVYCDTRSECYGIRNIAEITVKKNAIELLNKELSSKKIKGTVGTGSMNDPYMPVEKEIGITRKALEIINQKKFPVHVITKGELVTRDYDILQNISKTYAAVSFTVTCADDDLSQSLEPHAPKTSDRLKAMEFLAQKGIYTGVTLMPLLPYINDTTDNIEQILLKAKDAGASYIIPMFGTTLRKGSREYFYEALDRKFPGVKEKYQTNYGNEYICTSPHYRELDYCCKSLAQKLGLRIGMQFYEPPKDTQLSLFPA